MSIRASAHLPLFFLKTYSCTIFDADYVYDTLNSLDSLGPLQNNGGPTWTHALLRGSNAIDGGDARLGSIGPDSTPLASDQRGATRVVGARCDVGAFEYRPQLYIYLPVTLH